MDIHFLRQALAVGLFFAATAQATLYEAEGQELGSGAMIVTSDTVYETDMSQGWQIFDTTATLLVSGGKYVEATDFSFSVEVDETAMYDLSIRLWIKDLYVSGNTSVSIDGNLLGTYSTFSGSYNNKEFILEGSVKLNTGVTHTIEIKAANTAGIDYATVERHPSTEFSLSATPVTPKATKSAQKLKTFLRDNFTKATVSGMMIGDNAFNFHYGETLDDSWLIETCVPSDSCSLADSLTTWKGQEDIRLFKERSGYYPALGGFDMLFATGGHSGEGWFSGYTDNNIRMAKELWNLGGIPAFTWHWKVGEDTVFYSKGNGFHNAGCTDGVAGTSADNTCFNYTKAFSGDNCADINTASDEYKLLVADIDKISDRFLKLQEDGVAIVWRPLHEAAGGWFWWGIGGAECYKQLYKLVFNRMVNENGVKNALWVWNIERDPTIGYDYSALSPAWYPGDEYVDIVGVDIYNDPNIHHSNAKYFNKITSEIGSSKLIALTENGPIPDIDSTFEDESVWSFWMPWYDTWSGGFLNQTSDAVWQKNLADKRTIKLETMPGWSTVVADTSGKNAVVAPETSIPRSTISATNKLTVSLQGKTLLVNLARAGQGTVSLFDMLGHRIATLQRGSLNAGTHLFSLQNVANGLYIVRATGSFGTANRRILIK